MNLDIGLIGDSNYYIDIAFGRGKKAADKLRNSGMKGDRLRKSRAIESARVQTIGDNFSSNFDQICKAFPSFEQLTPFYKEIVKTTVDFPLLIKSLAAVNWARKKTSEFTRSYAQKINKCRDLEKINSYRREYYGRISSIPKQIDANLKFLEQTRRSFKDLPSIKSLPTIAIAGFPNVGKTTLLYKLTGSKPEISNYAFTTRKINVSYLTHNHKKIQVLDTPGTLNRFEKMNSIEKQAYLALRHVADQIIFVLDPTDTYSHEVQEILLENMKSFRKPITVYISKTDVCDKDTALKLKEKHKAITSAAELKKIIYGFFD